MTVDVTETIEVVVVNCDGDSLRFTREGNEEDLSVTFDIVDIGGTPRLTPQDARSLATHLNRFARGEL